MQNNNSNANNEEQTFIRKLGGLLGRGLATVGAAVTVRIVSQEASGTDPNNENDAMPRLVREFQKEFPVAAATLLAWHTTLGEETGANITEYAFNTARDTLLSFLYAPVYNPRAQPTSFADNVSENFIGRMSNGMLNYARNMYKG